MEHAPVRLQAILVGSLATWWFGMILGFVLGIASSGNGQSPMPLSGILKTVAFVLVAVAACSALGGLIGYTVEPFLRPTPDEWPFLGGISDIRSAFAVGIWRDAAYGSGFVATIVTAAHVHRRMA